MKKLDCLTQILFCYTSKISIVLINLTYNVGLFLPLEFIKIIFYNCAADLITNCSGIINKKQGCLI